MTILLLGGIVFTVILLIKQEELAAAGLVTSISSKIKGSSLSTNYWFAGASLFLANTALFAIAFAIFFFIPFGTTLGLVMCIPLSLFTWLIFSQVWGGSYKDKVKMVCIGNIFFLLFMGWTIWYYMTLEPAYPGDDLFMAWIGMIISIIFTVGAMSVSMFVILRKSQAE